MRNRYARTLAAGGAAILLAALGAPTALAAATVKTWTIHPGGAVHAKSGRVTLKTPRPAQCSRASQRPASP